MEASKGAGNFSCQHCQHPILISDGLDKHNAQVLASMTGPMCEVNFDSQTMSFDQYSPSFRLTDSANGTNGFTVISDSGLKEPRLSQKMRVKAELLDKLSCHSETNHPMCVECTDTMIEMIDKKLLMAEKDRIDFEQYVNVGIDTTEERTDLEKLDLELASISLEEEQLLAELNGLKSEEESLKASFKEHEKEQQRLQEQELNFTRKITEIRQDLMITEDAKQSVDQQLMYAQILLGKLKNTNVFDATFHIWHDGPFGTINKFRLGRLPSKPVDWPEINAAWGQTALLLAALARKIDLTFERYCLVPLGDHSYITELKTGNHLPLHGTGGIKFYFDPKFDAAMVAYLDCFQQFHEKVVASGSGFRLPYKMDKGKIESPEGRVAYSIKVQFNSEEQWTKALKYLLTNLKWGLAWVASQFVEE